MNTVLIDVQGIPAPDWMGELESFVDEILRNMTRDEWEVSVILCDDDVIAAFNREYRSKEGPTDVLSFPQVENANEIPLKGRFVAGDIVVSLDSVRANAKYFGASAEEELKRVIIHSLLHLSGMDHSTNESDEPMLILQEQILSNYKGTARFHL